MSTLVLFVLLRVGFWLFAPPNPDEAYYWLWGQHLDFSYYDHPPLQSWLQGLTTALLGKSLFTLRLLNVLTNGIFFYTYYCILQYLYGDRAKRYIWWVILALFASPLYSIMLSLAWHDHLAIALSLVGAYLCIRFLDAYLANGKAQNAKSENWRLYGSAIALSLAHITKYNSLFMTLGLLVAIAMHPQLRKLFRDFRLWVCAGIGVIIFSPIFYWNYSNNFQSFRFYASRSVDSGLPIMRLLEPLGFIGISLLMLSPFVVWLLWQGWNYSESKANLSLQNPVYMHVAFWTFAVSTVLLMAISLISTALYYWNIHAYLLLFPLLPLAIYPQRLSHSPINRKSITFSIYGLQIFGLLFTALFVWNSSIFPVSALLGKDGDQDGRMLFGWSEVSAEVQKIANSLPEKPLIITSDYRSAATLAYAMHDRDVTAISKRISQFTLWNLQNQAQQKGKTAILISDQWYPLSEEAIAKFEQVTPINQVPISRFGVYLKTYEIAIATNYQT